MEEEKIKRHYKVEPGDYLIVYRNEFGGNTFYKVCLSKTNFDGTKTWFSKPVAFKKEVNLEDKTKIKVLDFFEDVRENKNDKYNPIWSLFITEFEIVNQDNTQAFNDFNSSLNSNEYNISEDDLPF